MRTSSVIQLVLINATLIALLALVREDQLFRLDYWRTIGFTPQTVYSIFLVRFPAVNGSVSLPGLPTLDWAQVFLVAVVLLDIYCIAVAYTGRSSPAPTGTAPPA